MQRPAPSSSASPTAASWVLAGIFILGGTVILSGCEDKAIGRLCDVQADGGPYQAVFNGLALECPSRICLRPAKDNTKGTEVDTAPLCSAECSKDSDCDGEKRGSRTNDHRCLTGFVCGVAFEVGPLCCKKLCMCKDFVTIPQGGLQKPESCKQTKMQNSCVNL